MFCDIEGFETRIGYLDVKSSPVYFYVQRNTNFETKGTPIPFDVEILNVGGAMNSTSGKFTAPRNGTNFHSPERRIFLRLHQEFILT